MKVRVTNVAPFHIEPLKGKKWVPVFNQAIDILDDLKLEWQIGGGTLLGLYRDGDVIAHDTDLDFEVFVDDKFSLEVSLNRLFATNDFRLIRTQHCTRGPSQIAYLHKDTNIIVDVFFYYYSEEDGCYVNYNEYGELLRPVESVKEVKQHFVDSMIDYVDVPVEVESYLSFRYGEDWKTPKKEKVSWENDTGNALR